MENSFIMWKFVGNGTGRYFALDERLYHCSYTASLKQRMYLYWKNLQTQTIFNSRNCTLACLDIVIISYEI
jgi:hypothetical protein